MKKILVSQGKLIRNVFLILAIFSVTNSCKKSSDKPSANEVYIENMAFTPSTRTVYINTTVTWTNKDAMTHNVTSNAVLFDSGLIPKNESYSFTFTSVGSFPYHCSIHPSMVGTIVVITSPQ